jgi:hypothetical protein
MKFIGWLVFILPIALLVYGIWYIKDSTPFLIVVYTTGVMIAAILGLMTIVLLFKLLERIFSMWLNLVKMLVTGQNNRSL